MAQRSGRGGRPTPALLPMALVLISVVAASALDDPCATAMSGMNNTAPGLLPGAPGRRAVPPARCPPRGRAGLITRPVRAGPAPNCGACLVAWVRDRLDVRRVSCRWCLPANASAPRAAGYCYNAFRNRTAAQDACPVEVSPPKRARARRAVSPQLIYTRACAAHVTRRT